MPRQEKFETFVGKTYKEGSLEKRKEIRTDYENIEDQINSYYEKKITAKNLVDNLGLVILGSQGEHASTQIYAYENLIKTIAETEKEEDIDIIAEEIFYSAATENNPMKKAYLLGILNNFSNLERLEELFSKKDETNNSVDVKNTEEIDIIQKIRKAALRIKKEGKVSEQEEEVLNYVLDNFPRDNNECESARLVSVYYSKENYATRMPALGKQKLLEDEVWKCLEGNGIPRYVYALPAGWHPSGEKLDEADRFGINLTQQAAIFEGKEKIFIEYDMNPRLSRLYNRRIKYYRDQKNLKKVEELENALKLRVWREIEKDPEAMETFQSIDNIVIIKKTIRDYADDVDINNLMEKDFRDDAVQ